MLGLVVSTSRKQCEYFPSKPCSIRLNKYILNICLQLQYSAITKPVLHIQINEKKTKLQKYNYEITHYTYKHWQVQISNNCNIYIFQLKIYS